MAYTISAPRRIIGVVGAKNLSEFEGLSTLCEKLGRHIARNDCWLICGGTTGVMEVVPKGVKAEGGFTIGIVPKGISKLSQKNKDREWPSSHIDVAIFSGLGGGIKGRNKVIVCSSDAVIALPGSNKKNEGTRSEIDFAIELGVPVILHPHWRTVEDPDPIAPKPPLVDYFEDVKDAVPMALEAISRNKQWPELTTARRQGC